MTKAEARLEALKLAVRPGIDGVTILETADSYFRFITMDENPPVSEPERTKKAAK
jgi:hypothetical protein